MLLVYVYLPFKLRATQCDDIRLLLHLEAVATFAILCPVFASVSELNLIAVMRI